MTDELMTRIAAQEREIAHLKETRARLSKTNLEYHSQAVAMRRVVDMARVAVAWWATSVCTDPRYRGLTATSWVGRMNLALDQLDKITKERTEESAP